MKYNTNLASEFWVLSALHRLGVEAFLKLGNKKSVDIVVRNGTEVFDVEVEGLEKRFDCPADNIIEFQNPNHVYVILTFNWKITDPSACPDVWVIPALEMKQFIKEYRTRKVISRSLISQNGNLYHTDWRCFSN